MWSVTLNQIGFLLKQLNTERRKFAPQRPLVHITNIRSPGPPSPAILSSMIKLIKFDENAFLYEADKTQYKFSDNLIKVGTTRPCKRGLVLNFNEKSQYLVVFTLIENSDQTRSFLFKCVRIDHPSWENEGVSHEIR